MSDRDPKFIPILISMVLFGFFELYFEHQGIKKQGGYKSKTYIGAGGESLVAGIRFAWQTPYHAGTLTQIATILLMFATNWL